MQNISLTNRMLYMLGCLKVNQKQQDKRMITALTGELSSNEKVPLSARSD